MNLFPHQIDALEKTKNLNKVAYYHDMGLGKTFTGAEKMIRLGAKVNLVICQKSKINDWIQHFDKYYPEILNYDLTNKKFFETFLTEIQTLDEYDVAVAVINYELAWRRPELLKLTDFTLMLDESSLIQNKSAKQTKFILKLKPKNVILLSGTPTSGKYENLWTQAHLLGWEISDKLYQKQYVNWTTLNIGMQSFNVVDKKHPYKNVERLKQKFREHGAVFLKTEECFQLPEQIITEIKVPKSKEYDRFMKTSVVELEDRTLIGDTSLSKRIYARQICSTYSEDKLKAFCDLIQSTNDRLIVFYNFNDEVARLIDYIGERPMSIINGLTKDLKAFEECDDSITFVQYQAGSMGLNLQKANKIIYFSLPERSELFEQSKKRIHRIGQNQTCFYYITLCEKSVEELIYQTLKERRDFTDELFKQL